MSHEWIKQIREGDVLQSASGVLRVVRLANHYGESIGKTTVYFAIRHQSWTNRAYTVVNGNDLRFFGYRPTGIRVRLTSKFDRQLRADMRKKGGLENQRYRASHAAGRP